MSHSAAEAWKDAAASYVLDQQSLEADLAAAAYGYDGALDDDYGKLRSEAHELRIALESVMLRAGESFVAAVEGGEPAYLSAEQLEEQVIALDLPLRLHPKQAAAVILEVLSMPADQTRQHLTRVLDAYTLFSFLQQTPDVQKALSRVFTNAKIWLDTSTVLPLVAESLIDDENKRLETALLSAASDSGVGLYVTDGVIEELRYHIEKCINYVRQSLRDGEPPFLYAAYMLSGRDERQFAAWTADIHGSVHPDLDIEDYLYTKFQIVRKDLAEVAAKADPKLRAAVTKLFQEKHNRSHNRQDGRLRSPTIINRLVSHDVESVVGVIELRRDSRPELGYEAWWLTLDKTAYRLKRWLSDNLGKGAPDTPALSPDYLSQLLRLGPLRRSLRSEDAQNLPLIIDVTRLESVPSELIEVARNTRLSLEGLDERRIRREVRDALHRAHTTLRSNHDYGSAAQSSVARRLTAQRNK
ncbi:hypothetical protein P0W64_22355 [Tsukamurella sp. 8F]|uniref:hypothetical protein n=1 Tax=unclassified Tsukamurella TaxID=2633480 RepID=UPI0023B92F4A|nr:MULTISPECIES: hypothetical protein [unclassified Tsukamurella]MDF0532629.1 hypothetical protein [Tsukamurella sp. 8J]MDF0589532.1 hypothetical protein [Tsukamurella sp. 8F]